MAVIKRTSNISFCISLSEHPHEIDQIDVIFGETIFIVHNSGYMTYVQGAPKRTEKTTFYMIKKIPEVNPYILCEDIYERLTNREIDWIEEYVSKGIKKIQSEINEMMKLYKE